MKKQIALLLVVVLVFSLTACGGGNTAEQPNGSETIATASSGTEASTVKEESSEPIESSVAEPEATVEPQPAEEPEPPEEPEPTEEPEPSVEPESVEEPPEPEVQKYVIGETVSTDIIEFTLNDAALSYYADAQFSPAEDGGYTASKGYTLVCLDFTITNTDRGGSLNTNDVNVVSFEVNQNENTSSVAGYGSDGKPKMYGVSGYSLVGALISENDGDFESNNTSNIIIHAGETDRIRMLGMIFFEAEDLTAPFDLVVTVKASSGVENFTYTIS